MTSVSQTGWRFDLRGLQMGPVDHEYEDGRRFVTAKLWLSFGIGKDVELSITTHWLDGESELDVNERVLRMWSGKFDRLSEALSESADMYARLAAEEN